MGSLLGIIAMLANIVGVICWIIILIPLFQQKGVLHGILGILCFLYAFIWGWMNADRLGKKQVMIIWTIALIAAVVLGGMSGFAAGSAGLPAS